MEQCVRNDPKDKIEFRFPGGGGVASGSHAINVFALLCIAALILLAVIALR
jgi:hypothetical protein